MYPKAIRYIVLLFLLNFIILVSNIVYRDPFASVISDLDYSKLFLFLSGISLMIFVILSSSYKEFRVVIIIASISFLSLSIFFNLRLAKANFNRIQCNKSLIEYYDYFEVDSCVEITKKFKQDVINEEIKYFQKEHNSDKEFEEIIRDHYGIELIAASCTQFTSITCYNELVKDYIAKKNE